jgi:hypothetical protein
VPDRALKDLKGHGGEIVAPVQATSQAKSIRGVVASSAPHFCFAKNATIFFRSFVLSL